MQDKIDVNGPNTHPVYQCIKREQPASQGGIALPGKSAAGNVVIAERLVYKACSVCSDSLLTRGWHPGGAIEWNYVKAITDLKGRPVKRFGPSFDPIAFEGDVRLQASLHS